MRYIASVAAVLAAGPVAAHVTDAPHVHGDQVGALIVGLALIAVVGGIVGGVAASRVRARRK